MAFLEGHGRSGTGLKEDEVKALDAADGLVEDDAAVFDIAVGLEGE